MATFRLPSCCLTRLSLKWKLTNPCHATSRNLLQISCQTIGAGEDRTFYLSLAMWLFWPFEITRLPCDTRQVSLGKTLHFLSSLKLTQSTVDVKLSKNLPSLSLKMLDQLSTKSYASAIFTQLQKFDFCRMQTYSWKLLI